MNRVIVIVLLALAVDAHADPSARAKADATAAYTDGQRRYLAEDYEGAAKQFLVAFNLDPDPAYLFNVAQAYRFAKQCARSIKHYKQFLGIVRNPPNKADIAKYIADQEACAKAQPPPGPDPEPSKPDPKPDPKADPQPIKVDPPRRDPEAPADPGRWPKRFALASFAVGAIGAGIGVRYALRRVSIRKDRDAFLASCAEQGSCEATEYQRQNDIFDARAANAKTPMIVGFAVGGAAIAAGVLLYVTGRYITGKHRSERVAVTPTRSGGVVSLTFSH
jgi:tetratricopeptide (TPR) repeat protein